jgi:putative flippase GtrA
MPLNRNIKQLFRYLITGFTAFGIEYGLYILLYKFIGLYYIWSSFIVYAIVFMFSFFVNRNWSFESKGDVRRQMMLYFLLFLFNLFFGNIVLLYVLTEYLGLNPLFSPFVKMAFIVCWNFLIYKYIIYK